MQPSRGAYVHTSLWACACVSLLPTQVALSPRPYTLYRWHTPLGDNAVDILSRLFNLPGGSLKEHLALARRLLPQALAAPASAAEQTPGPGRVKALSSETGKKAA